jgi:Ca2+-binding EF-hand superfamily protein
MNKRMNKTILTLSSAIILGFSAPISMAEDGMSFVQVAKGGNKPARQMARFDINQDGQITRDEVQVVRETRFKKMDADSSGGVSLKEFEAAAKARFAKKRSRFRTEAGEPDSPDEGARRGQRSSKRKGKRLKAKFNRLDNNKDGQISLKEFTAKVQFFDRFDTNKDGVITMEELNQKNRRRR